MNFDNIQMSGSNSNMSCIDWHSNQSKLHYKLIDNIVSELSVRFDLCELYELRFFLNVIHFHKYLANEEAEITR